MLNLFSWCVSKGHHQFFTCVCFQVNFLIHVVQFLLDKNYNMTNLNFKLKVAVCGSKSVGKSGMIVSELLYDQTFNFLFHTAITVRYLTKRFISEYNSSREHLYKQTVQFEDSVLAEIEIMDTICVIVTIQLWIWLLVSHLNYVIHT